MTRSGSPAVASSPPSASATTTTPRCRLSTNPDRSTSARTSTAASLCKGFAGGALRRPGSGLRPPEGERSGLGNGVRRAVHSPSRRTPSVMEGGVEAGEAGGHGVEGVGDREDPRPGRDGLAGQAGRVALAVPALVVAADHLDGAAQRLDAGHHLDPEQRVGPHHLPLAGVQRPRLVEHRLGDADLADVVEQEPVAQLLVGGQLGGDGLGQGDRVVVVRWRCALVLGSLASTTKARVLIMARYDPRRRSRARSSSAARAGSAWYRWLISRAKTSSWRSAASSCSRWLAPGSTAQPSVSRLTASSRARDENGLTRWPSGAPARPGGCRGGPGAGAAGTRRRPPRPRPPRGGPAARAGRAARPPR